MSHNNTDDVANSRAASRPGQTIAESGPLESALDGSTGSAPESFPSTRPQTPGCEDAMAAADAIPPCTSITSQVSVRPGIHFGVPDPFVSPTGSEHSHSRSPSLYTPTTSTGGQPHTHTHNSSSLTASSRSHSGASFVRGVAPPVTRSRASNAGRPSTGSSIGSTNNVNYVTSNTADFSINPVVPSSTSNRPSTASSSIRETFSSPPAFMRPNSVYYSSAMDKGPVSGTSTPNAYTEHNTPASSSAGLNLTAGMNMAYVPGLSVTGDGDPGFANISSTEFDDQDGKINPDNVLMKSSLLQGPIEKPWLQKKDWKVRASWYITFVMIMLGFAGSGLSCYLGYKNTPMISQPLCLVMEDNFDTFDVDTDGATWTHEVDMSGFGNGEFEMTTASPNNSFVQDGMLYIMPTLTSLSIPGGNDSVFDGFTYNITGCTNDQNFKGTGCGAVSNKTAGTIINPVMSARLTTKKSHSIQYGKVEIRAKIPTGDWLWPALWMLPVDNVYGPWPLSGEIDIMESRGNGIQYPGGSNLVRGSLNWGPEAIFNAVYKTFGDWSDRRRSFTSGFHTYTLEWTPTFIRTYVDSRLHHMLDIRFNVPMFSRGNFPATYQNGSQTVALQNPWIGRGNSAPFDQPFFLIMNVAVGGTNGWFSDNAGGKPWLDRSATAMRDFALAQDKWYSTWSSNPEDRAMVVDYVKMWKLC